MNKHNIHFWMTWILLVGIGAHFVQYHFETSEQTCESVKEKIWAFQQCLKFQPACRVDGPKSFATYHRNKDWVQQNCSDDGDDLLSQKTQE